MRVREDPGVIFMNATLVAKIPKNQLEEIRVSVLKNNKIDVRTFFLYPGEPKHRPTRKGIWLSYRHVPSILCAFDRYIKNPEKEFDFDLESKENEKIRVYVKEYKGSKIVHVRTFYLKDNEYLPGKGISFPVPLVEEMSHALKQLPKSA